MAVTVINSELGWEPAVQHVGYRNEYSSNQKVASGQPLHGVNVDAEIIHDWRKGDVEEGFIEGGQKCCGRRNGNHPAWR